MLECGICLQPVEEPIKHDICGKGFHRPHLASWFILKNINCPYCKFPFAQLIIDELAPKSKEELRYLRKFNDIFDKIPTRPDFSKDIKNKEWNIPRKQNSIPNIISIGFKIIMLLISTGFAAMFVYAEILILLDQNAGSISFKTHLLVIISTLLFVVFSIEIIKKLKTDWAEYRMQHGLLQPIV